MLNYLTPNNLYQAFVFLLDVGIVAIAIFFCLKVIEKNTRTVQIFKGILFVFLLNGAAQLIGLKTIEYFTSQFLNWGVLALFIIFQPEIRSLLEKLGKTTVFSRMATLTVNQKEAVVNELVKASIGLSNSKTGALISIEQNQSLSEYIKTGTPVGSEVSSELLGTIFLYGTPLHDGAVIIQGDKIACASAYFPPTTKDFPSSYGARHRAGVGISEVSDCITIIVSEETGKISVAKDGELEVMTPIELRTYLTEIICAPAQEEEEKDNKMKLSFPTFKPKKKNQKRNSKKKDDRISVTQVVAFNVDEQGKRGEQDEKE